MREQADTGITAQTALPIGMTDADESYPVVFVDTVDTDPQRVEADALQKINNVLAEAMQTVYPEACGPATLLKVHVGEPRGTTRMRPDLARAAAAFASRPDIFHRLVPLCFGTRTDFFMSEREVLDEVVSNRDAILTDPGHESLTMQNPEYELFDIGKSVCGVCTGPACDAPGHGRSYPLCSQSSDAFEHQR